VGVDETGHYGPARRVEGQPTGEAGDVADRDDPAGVDGDACAGDAPDQVGRVPGAGEDFCRTGD
jgi:hypothetical protein